MNLACERQFEVIQLIQVHVRIPHGLNFSEPKEKKGQFQSIAFVKT